MMKILFIINSLGGGGAERVLVNLVNSMDRTKYDITVETMFGDGVNAGLLNDDIRYISKKAPCPRGIAYIFRFIPSKLLYKYFIGSEKYDIIVAYMHGAPVKVISGCPNKSVKKVAWLHNGNPETSSFFKFWNNKKTAFKAYEKCDAIVGVSESVSNAFTNYTGIKRRICTVYNTNDVEKILSLADEGNSIDRQHRYELVSVGRVSNEKGFDRLYNACKRLRDEGFDIGVTIAGTGNQLDSMKNLISREKSNWFRFAGFQTNPYKFEKSSDMFICSSRTEGLSTAVTEAIILGLPVVSTDVSGAREILGENDEYGLVVENSEDGIYKGIKEMLSDPGKLEYYRIKAKERSSFFATENTVAQAQKLFDEIMN